MTQKIAIIGAGIAGLTAANVLSTADHTVTVFDKANRPGGRTCSRTMQTEIGELLFDHGAPEFMWSGKTPMPEEWAQKAWVDQLRQVWVGVPKMESLAAGMAANLDCRFNARAANITSQGDRFSLAFEDGMVARGFDQVICAIPAEQAAILLRQIRPEYSAAAGAVTSHPLWVGMVSFGSKINAPSPDIKWEDHPVLARAIYEAAKPGRSAPESWTLHASEMFTRMHLEDEKTSVAQKLADAFCDAVNAPKPLFQTAHRWRYSQPDNPLGEPCLYNDGLGVCGDWLIGGDIEGAWRSGTALAKCIIEGV